jgi:ribonuclease P protein component
VSRKLRHVVAPRLVELPPGTQLVIRALPAAARASSADLDSDVRQALIDLVRKGISS